MAKTSHRFTIFIVVITVVIDMLGFGIAFPILPVMFDDVELYFGSAIPVQRLEFVYGLLIACFAIFQFIGAPILGAFADRWGRKPVLFISVAGTMLGLILFTWGILKHDLFLLFFGRSIQGLFGGNVAICYSIVADISSTKDKAKNFGLVGVAFGLGIILGGGLGGYLSNPDFLSWFSFSTPFWFLIGLNVINLLLISAYLKETVRKRQEKRVSILSGFRGMVKGFMHPGLTMPYTVVLIHSFAFAFFTHLIPLYVIDKFGFDVSDLGNLFLYVGVWGIFSQAVLIRPVSAKFTEAGVVMFTSVLLILGYALLLVPDDSTYYYWILPILAIAHGLYLSNIAALLSNVGSSGMQGEVLGVYQSLHSVSNAIPPIIGGLAIWEYGVALPIWLAIGCSAMATFLFAIYFVGSKWTWYR